MRVYLNGSEIEIAEALSLEALVVQKGLDPNTIVVEHNQVIQPKEEWSQIALMADDKLEIITFVGGG